MDTITLLHRLSVELARRGFGLGHTLTPLDCQLFDLPIQWRDQSVGELLSQLTEDHLIDLHCHLTGRLPGDPATEPGTADPATEITLRPAAGSPVRMLLADILRAIEEAGYRVISGQTSRLLDEPWLEESTDEYIDIIIHPWPRRAAAPLVAASAEPVPAVATPADMAAMRSGPCATTDLAGDTVSPAEPTLEPADRTAEERG